MTKTPMQLIQDVIEHGGAIVSSNDASLIEIANAEACGRFAVNADGFGFVRRTKEWLEYVKSREGLLTVAQPATPDTSKPIPYMGPPRVSLD